MKKALKYLAGEKVLEVSLALAVISMFVVPPDAGYAGYIDWDVLMLLFSLMAVVAGLKGCGVFGAVSGFLTRRAGSIRSLTVLLTLACFFFSMVVTNDVALITFVPLTAGILAAAKPSVLIYVVTLETVAANLGSMATPIGNPQNLFLYSHYAMSLGDFFGAVLPLTGISLVMLIVMCLAVKGGGERVSAGEGGSADWKRLWIYLALLAVCLLSVFRVLPKYACCALVALYALIFERKLFRQVDFALLATFACFFVFVGNIARIDAVSGLLSRVIAGSELEAGIIASQVISNVPAALMLSGFTQDAAALMQGVDIGGLGTLVASLASLISFKAYMKTPEAKAGKYLACFTLINAAFLAVLYAAAKFVL